MKKNPLEELAIQLGGTFGITDTEKKYGPSKVPLTKKQRKARAKSKRSKRSRKINYRKNK